MKTVLLLLSCLTLSAQPVKFAWDQSVETNIVGYRVVGGLASRAYTLTNIVSGRATTNVTVTNLPAGITYWAVSALAADGTLSDPSNEASVTNRDFAPKNFKASAVLQASQSVTGPWSTLATLPLPMTNQTFVRTRILLEELPNE